MTLQCNGVLSLSAGRRLTQVAEGTERSWTLRWREVDSNFQFSGR
jgi:hypothetical protein